MAEVKEMYVCLVWWSGGEEMWVVWCGFNIGLLLSQTRYRDGIQFPSSALAYLNLRIVFRFTRFILGILFMLEENYNILTIILHPSYIVWRYGNTSLDPVYYNYVNTYTHIRAGLLSCFCQTLRSQILDLGSCLFPAKRRGVTVRKKTCSNTLHLARDLNLGPLVCEPNVLTTTPPCQLYMCC